MTDLKAPDFNLTTHGVQVVPCLDSTLLSYYNTNIWQEIKSFPELAKRDPVHGQVNTSELVKGAFGAFGNPSSFHNTHVRSLRIKALIHVVPVLKPVASGRSLCHLLDRLCVRRKGTACGKESWHRDQSELRTSNTGIQDSIFGGWINLDNENQYFSCVPGTHIMRDNTIGFKKLSPDEIREYDSKRQLITVPPGHIVIFYQHIVHEVLSKKMKQDSLRLFLGWCLTAFSEPPVHSKHELSKIITDQAVPRLPSGQQCPMYSPNHISFFKADLIDWSKNTFKEQCLEDKKSKGDIESYKVVHKHMKSLKEYNLPLYKAYSQIEIDILFPNKRWEINLAGGKKEVVEL